MKVHILRLSDHKQTEANITEADKTNLPTVTDGWRFNFKKHSKKVGFKTYTLVCEESPDVIEGCITFMLKNKSEPYMAYIEVAPHNMGKTKRYDKVAGCLIAYACRLSFLHGEDHFKGWLSFDVKEEQKDNEIKLMAMYCKKYGALKFGETTMVIQPETGEKLIEKFLN